jgi:cyanate lyase
LLLDIIVCPVTQSTSSKQLTIFLSLRQWNKADTWDDASHALRRGRVWCVKIYWAVFQLLADNYRRLVQVLDYRHILPLLEEWSTEMEHYSGCIPDVLMASHGKWLGLAMVMLLMY